MWRGGDWWPSEPHFAVRSPEIEERRALARGGVDDFADEDGMIAADDLVVHAAFERAKSVRNERHAEGSAADLQAGELVAAAGGGAAGAVGLIHGQDGDAKGLRLHDGVVARRRLGNADEDERRVQRQRGE